VSVPGTGSCNVRAASAGEKDFGHRARRSPGSDPGALEPELPDTHAADLRGGWVSQRKSHGSAGTSFGRRRRRRFGSPNLLIMNAEQRGWGKFLEIVAANARTEFPGGNVMGPPFFSVLRTFSMFLCYVVIVVSWRFESGAGHGIRRGQWGDPFVTGQHVSTSRKGTNCAGAWPTDQGGPGRIVCRTYRLRRDLGARHSPVVCPGSTS